MVRTVNLESYFMKKNYLKVILISFIFIGCSRNEIETIPLNPKSSYETLPASNTKKLKEIPFENLPYELSRPFNEKNALSVKSNKNKSYFGSIDTGIPVKQVTTEEGKLSYTFVLHKKAGDTSEKPIYFDNLVIFEQGKGQVEQYVIRYQPTLEWYKTNRDFKEYSGKITFYTIGGAFINSLQLNTDSNKNYASRSSHCAVRFKEAGTVCTDGGSINGEGSMADWTCHTTYNYEVNCTAGGAGFGGPTSGGGSSGGSSGDGSGSNGMVSTTLSL